MAQHPLRDRYANIATFDVTETAAGTLTFAELRTSAGIDASRKTATALLVDEIDYFIGVAAYADMTSNGDDILMAITISSSVTDLQDMADSRILHSNIVTRVDFGTAGSAQLVKAPLVSQFFPPLITAERSLFLGVVSAGLASAVNVRARVYYRTVQLTDGEFLELAEVFRLVG